MARPSPIVNPAVKITPKQLAFEIGATIDTLCDWRQAKVGPPYHREVGRIYYYRDEIEVWKESTKWA